MKSAPRRTTATLKLGLALWALLAPAAFAAVIDGAPIERAPLQLALPFAAASPAALMPAAALTPMLAVPVLPAFALAAPVSAAPLAAAPVAIAPTAVAPVAAAASFGAAPVAAEYAAHWSQMPPAVAQAFRSGDPRAFWDACRSAGFEPPESDDAQWNLLREGADQHEADRLALARFSPRAPDSAPARARATKIDYDAFGAALARRPGLGQGIFQHSDAKRAILKAAGYTHLHASGGQRIPIDDASDARIGRAFEATSRAYRNRSR